MTGSELGRRRGERGVTQEAVAKALGVSQPYLSLLENGDRPITQKLKNRAVRLFNLRPTELPAKAKSYKIAKSTDDQLAADLSALGYLGFSHLKPSHTKNPGDVLLSALNSPKRDARLVEALPWVVLEYPDMDWTDLVKTAKAHDLQNRLGFVVAVARRVAEFRQDRETTTKLKRLEVQLKYSLLAREHTLCNETMTNAERKWLATQRPAAAEEWNLLTDLSPDHLNYYVV